MDIFEEFPTTLEFDSREERYSIYIDAAGHEVRVAHTTGVRLVDINHLALGTVWEGWCVEHYMVARHRLAPEFADHLADLLVDPADVDEVGFCNDCMTPHFTEYLCSTGSGVMVCESCDDNYFGCTCCEERYAVLTNTLDGGSVCNGCLSDRYTYCEDCEGSYRDGTDHDHNDDGCCESPAMAFTVRNDGAEPLANDVRTRVSLAAGIITEEGMCAIAALVSSHGNVLYNAAPSAEKRAPGAEWSKWWALANRIEEVGERWQTKRGNFPKRLSSFAYKEFKLKLPPDLVSAVGNVGREHSTGSDYAIEVTRNLNLPRTEFAHSGSCWWSEYAESRCALKTNGGFGLRTFGEEGDYVAGRAWVMPLLYDPEADAFSPTFETMTPHAFVVFNGYGNLQGWIPARIVAHMAGMTYRKIGFECSPMYVNSDSGYLVAPEEIAEKYTDGGLSLSLPQHSTLYQTEINQAKELSHV